LQNCIIVVVKVFWLFLLVTFPSFGQNYRNIQLLDNWKNDSIIVNSSKARYNDCWGFTANGSEYAVIGSTMGTHFFQISPSGKLKEVDFVQGKFSSTQVIHRDLKTYENYLYAVCDEGNSSLQIIDLQYLPDSVHVLNDLQGDFGRIHNIFIDSAQAMLYAFSVTPIIAGMTQPKKPMSVFSIANPVNPVLLWSGPNDIPEVHDGYISNNKAILNCGFDGLRLYDFSNPNNPIFEQNISIYKEQGYNHQGWLSPDGKTYIFGDETNGKKLKKCSFDGNGQLQIDSYFGTDFEDGSVPHNIMLDNRFAFVAYYNSGLRVYDYTTQTISEVAFYDTYPDNTAFKMNGAWGIFSDLPSGKILISDRQYGLFVFGFNKTPFSLDNIDLVNLYPNPVKSGTDLKFLIKDFLGSDIQLTISDCTGKKVLETSWTKSLQYFEQRINLSQGVYHVVITYIGTGNSEKKWTRKLVVN
jgi:choice-of-anchor B domain-containing protein